MFSRGPKEPGEAMDSLAFGFVGEGLLCYSENALCVHVWVVSNGFLVRKQLVESFLDSF